MPYNNFVVIGYNEYTAVSPQKVADAKFTSEEEKGDAAIGVNYTKVRALKNDVAKAQLLNFGRVVEIARKKINANSALSVSTTLKLFVAPEFLFKAKAKSKNGLFAFSHDDRSNIIEALAHMFSGSAYQDWVIAPGTIFWEWKSKSSVLYTGMNTGILVDGGNNRYVTCTKHYASDGDNFGMEHYPQETLSLEDIEALYEKPDDLILNKDNRKMAIEICNDHNIRYMILKRAMLSLGIEAIGTSTANLEKRLDFHLLIAAGKIFTPPSIIAKKGGYAIRCDGIKLDSSTVEVCKIDDQKYGWDTEFVDKILRKTAELERYKKLDTGDGKLFTSEDKKLLTQITNIEKYVEEKGAPTTLGSALSITENNALPDDLATRNAPKGKPSLIYSELIPF
jgi:hypothetical protein